MALEDKLRHVMDFPKQGIDFIDITTLLKDKDAYKESIDRMIAAVEQFGDFDYIISPEARGFVFGAPMAYILGKGFVPVRKAGKLPAHTISLQYDLEYGTQDIEIHEDAVEPNAKVIIVDDLLATGGTSIAMVRLLEKIQAKVVGTLFFIELTYLDGRKRMLDYPCETIIRITE